MRKTKLIKNGNYWLSFSEISNIPVNTNNESKSIADDSWNSLVYEISTSDLDLKNIVLSNEQKNLINLILEERKNLEKVKKFNLPLSSKILLYWPPWTWKTLTSYCLAWALWKKLLTVNLSTLVSSKLWETSKNIDRIFARARNLWAVLFIDEFDSISRDREFSDDHWEMKRVVNVLLQIFDLSSENTIVLAATNRLKDIDTALLRRFDLTINYKLPWKAEIEKYLAFIMLTYWFAFDKKTTQNKFIRGFEGKNYSDIKRSMVNLLKSIVLNSSNTLEKITLQSNDANNLTE